MGELNCDAASGKCGRGSFTRDRKRLADPQRVGDEDGGSLLQSRVNW